MNRRKYPMLRSMIAIAVAATLAVGCATAPEAPAGSAQVRTKLTALQRDAKLATLAPVALKDAEQAVQRAEVPESAEITL